MQLGPISKISPNFNIDSPMSTSLQSQLSFDQISGAEKPSFMQVVGKVLNQANETLAVPDTLMHSAMVGDSVDVHDVMVANAQADVVLNITTQAATKVLQAYDRIMQIQI